MNPNVSSSSSSDSSTRVLGIRKRLDSSVNESSTSVALFKRPRLSTDARMIRPLSRFKNDPDRDMCPAGSPLRPLSRSSSFTGLSRGSSPLFADDTPGHDLMRSVSASSLRSSSPIVQTYPEVSAKHHMHPSKLSIDYTIPNPPDPISARILACSADNVAFFTRGNRVFFKNLNSSGNEEVTQLLKLSDTRGNVRAIECGGKANTGVIAIGTSGGFVQTWDIQTKKLIMTLPTAKEITALAWNGPTLTVGGMKGTIRIYDTRISPVEKMREQSRKITRHQGQITSLSWNENGKLLASGDSSGMVHCFEAGQVVPLNVGEFVQRRKKMQHDGGISAVAWCPYTHNLLATGDTRGILRLWTINQRDPHSNAVTPGRVDTGAIITGVHFSEQCKEILTTHGAATPVDPPPPPPPGTYVPPTPPKISMANSLTVHSNSLRHVSTVKTVGDKPIGDSVLNSTGLKVIFSVPDEAKINVYDVWTKRKELKRQPSLTSDPAAYKLR